MCKLACHFAIVGEKEYTSCVAVQATYWVDTLWASILNEIHNGLTLLWIVACSNIILWLVEKHVNLLLQCYRLIVELNLVATQYLCTQLCNNLSVYCYYSCLDEVISLTA